MSKKQVTFILRNDEITIIPFASDEEFFPELAKIRKEAKRQGVVLEKGQVIPCG